MAVQTRKKKHSLILRLLLIAVAVYVAVSFVQLQLDLSAKRLELASIQNAVDAQLLENQELEALLTARQEDDYIEWVARERLDYAFPDEKVFVDISGS